MGLLAWPPTPHTRGPWLPCLRDTSAWLSAILVIRGQKTMLGEAMAAGPEVEGPCLFIHRLSETLQC